MTAAQQGWSSPKGAFLSGARWFQGDGVLPGWARPWGQCISRLRRGLPGRDSAAAHVDPQARRPALPRCRHPAQGESRKQPRLLPAAGPRRWCSWPGPCGRGSRCDHCWTRCVQATPMADAGLEEVTRHPLCPWQRLRPTRMPLLSGCCDPLQGAVPTQVTRDGGLSPQPPP